MIYTAVFINKKFYILKFSVQSSIILELDAVMLTDYFLMDFQVMAAPFKNDILNMVAYVTKPVRFQIKPRYLHDINN